MSATYRYLRRRQARYRQRHRQKARPAIALVVAPVIIGLLAGAALLVVGGLGYYGDVRAGMRAPEEAIAARGGGARIYDRNGALLYESLDEEYGHQQRVTLDRISPLIQQATIAAEDASFYTNPGINVKGLTRAAIENFRPGDGFLEGSGGSSITQQLVKQIYFTTEEREARSFDRKFREAALAIELTRTRDKDQILEWYLNEVPYGGVFIGIEAAATGYFSEPARDVTLGQAAFLAGLPQSPTGYDPFTRFDRAIERQREVLDLMAKHGFITEAEAAWAKLETIELRPETPPFHAPHFVLYVGEYIKATLGEGALYRGGLEVTTTLDLGLQWKANAILEGHLQTYEDSTKGHNGSVVIIEPTTGQILTMVGSRDYWREDVDGEVNNALAVNSPGSALKPFTYATAFMQGWGPEWPIIDTPITYKEVDGKTFSPRNPDGRTRGVMPLKQALGNSYNIPAFKTVQWVGVDNMIATAKAMGITTLDRDLGPAVTLGGVDVKLLDMVYAYSTFANNGTMTGVPVTGELPPGNRTLDPVGVLRIVNSSGDTLMDVTATRTFEAIGAEYAYMITDILSNDANRQVTYGRGSNLNIPGWRAAVKTGTSEPYEGNKLIGDTWTIGYTTDLAIGVWIGNSDNSPMVNIFSTTIAGRTWHDMMVAAHEGRTARDFVRPPGLVEATVCVPSGLRADAGAKCPTVKGIFAEKALAKQTDNWWGGQFLGAAIPVSDRLARIPAEITGVKRALAEEYLRMYRGGTARVPSDRRRVNPHPRGSSRAGASPRSPTDGDATRAAIHGRRAAPATRTDTLGLAAAGWTTLIATPLKRGRGDRTASFTPAWA